MIVVVGGHTRNIGKTTAVCSIVQMTSSLDWTAVKITQYGHDQCADEGGECGCAPTNPAHPFAIDQQMAPDGTDSGRYLTAGARQSFWVRTRQGELAEAMPALREILRDASNTIVESNTVMAFLQPDLYLVVIDPRIEDFKRSAQIQLRRADAVIAAGPGSLPKLLEGKPAFTGPGDPALRELILGRATEIAATP